ncbi:unnamed protein product, partial [Mesorhabditis spiculigera]
MFWSKSVTTASALFYGYPVNVTGPSPTTVPTAMPTPVTLSGGSPSPAGLLGVDLAIVLDTSVTNSSYFKTMQAVITNAAANLAIYNDDTVPYGARLVLQTMAQTNRPNNFGDPWHIDFEYFEAQVGVLRPSSSQSVWQGPARKNRPLATMSSEHMRFLRRARSPTPIKLEN